MPELKPKTRLLRMLEVEVNKEPEDQREDFIRAVRLLVGNEEKKEMEHNLALGMTDCDLTKEQYLHWQSLDYNDNEIMKVFRIKRTAFQARKTKWGLNRKRVSSD